GEDGRGTGPQQQAAAQVLERRGRGGVADGEVRPQQRPAVEGTRAAHPARGAAGTAAVLQQGQRAGGEDLQGRVPGRRARCRPAPPQPGRHGGGTAGRLGQGGGGGRERSEERRVG